RRRHRPRRRPRRRQGPRRRRQGGFDRRKWRRERRGRGRRLGEESPPRRQLARPDARTVPRLHPWNLRGVSYFGPSPSSTAPSFRAATTNATWSSRLTPKIRTPSFTSARSTPAANFGVRNFFSTL